MDGNPDRPRSAIDGADVPRHLADALDWSADDLRRGRVEDARKALVRLQAKLDGHVARRS